MGTGTRHKMALMLCAEKVAQCKTRESPSRLKFALASFNFYLTRQFDKRLREGTGFNNKRKL